jgi:hypothetical protein
MKSIIRLSSFFLPVCFASLLGVFLPIFIVSQQEIKQFNAAGYIEFADIPFMRSGILIFCLLWTFFALVVVIINSRKIWLIIKLIPFLLIPTSIGLVYGAVSSYLIDNTIFVKIFPVPDFGIVSSGEGYAIYSHGQAVTFGLLFFLIIVALVCIIAALFIYATFKFYNFTYNNIISIVISHDYKLSNNDSHELKSSLPLKYWADGFEQKKDLRSKLPKRGSAEEIKYSFYNLGFVLIIGAFSVVSFIVYLPFILYFFM